MLPLVVLKLGTSCMWDHQCTYTAIEDCVSSVIFIQCIFSDMKTDHSRMCKINIYYLTVDLSRIFEGWRSIVFNGHFRLHKSVVWLLLICGAKHPSKFDDWPIRPSTKYNGWIMRILFSQKSMNWSISGSWVDELHIFTKDDEFNKRTFSPNSIKCFYQDYIRILKSKTCKQFLNI